MVGFVVYDLVFLAAFIVFTIWFLTARKKNLERQGILYLYKTKLGIAFIDSFTKRFRSILKPLQYVVIVSGYFLMATMIWLLSKSTYLYLTTSIANLIRAPPVFPVIPYFPQIFGLESLFPPLYFTYFILALGIIAIVHEFSHGIFARLYNLKIHSTGFAFLGPILGAFVEPDEKQMAKTSKFKQMVILAAGTFANVITALVFTGILALFFTTLFVPAGVKFSNYGFTQVSLENTTFVGNSSIEGYYELDADGERYFVDAAYWERASEKGVASAIVFEDTPAFAAQMKGAIVTIDGEPTRDLEELRRVLATHTPGETVTVATAILEPGRGTVAENKEYEITLIENSEGNAALGIVFLGNQNGGVMGFASDVYEKIKDPFTHYESKIGDFGWFIYYLLWWIVVLNFLVALFNMLPLGILDGGRFFFLTIWGITRSEKVGKWAYTLITWFILLLLVAMMVKWGTTFF